MNDFMRFYKGSMLFTIVGAFLAFAFLGGWQAMMTVLILGVLETSLSFDNAVVNAAKLETMDDKSKKWFLTWGMLIAVFGMRLFFPLAIVSMIGDMSMWKALTTALNDPAEYARILTSSHILVAGFGGAFLLMVFFKFFFDKEKEVHWIGFIEKHLGHLEATEVAATIGVVLVMSLWVPSAEVLSFLKASLYGLITYIAVDKFGSVMEGMDEQVSGSANTAVKSGIAGLLYLEVLDASCSFDGVIGSFAITTQIFIIMIGLGIGAMFVRSMTVQMVEKGTLNEFKYLEAGAFYSIGFLAITMLLNTFHEIPELVTGLTGAAFIIAAFISSVFADKDEECASSSCGQHCPGCPQKD
jgi:hypothetical protein